MKTALNSHYIAVSNLSPSQLADCPFRSQGSCPKVLKGDWGSCIVMLLDLIWMTILTQQ